jgi:hypothetical protein
VVLQDGAWIVGSGPDRAPKTDAPLADDD